MNHFLMAHLGFKTYQSEFLQVLREMGFAGETKPDLSVCQRAPIRSILLRWRNSNICSILCCPQKRGISASALFSRSTLATKRFRARTLRELGEAREMQREGMAMGGHSHQHRPLATLRYPELSADLTRNWDLIQKNLVPQEIWPFSYPYGKSDSYNREHSGNSSPAWLPAGALHRGRKQLTGMDSVQYSARRLRRTSLASAYRHQLSLNYLQGGQRPVPLSRSCGKALHAGLPGTG